MARTDVAFTGSIPEVYDRYLGALLFFPYAAELASRLQGRSGEVLEIAAGTGILTRVLDLVLAPDARITATDLNQPMLQHAARQGASGRVSWREADGQALPFPDASFDAAVCQFGVMFFPDRGAGYREARRVLRPGRPYLFTVWDSLDGNEVARLVHEAVAAAFPDNPPGFLARTPYGYHDPATIRREVAEAGFTELTLETVSRRGQAASAWDAALGVCQGTPLRAELETRGPEAVSRATEAAAERLAQRFGSGPVEGELRAHLVTATA
jgi:ubiquinone/menaquinone biosynthesis C-methylase UbiE